MLSIFTQRVVRTLRGLFACLLIVGCAQASAAISWTSYSAGVDEFTDKVRVNYAVAVADCSGNVPFWIQIYRDGNLIDQNYGVSGFYDDTAATPGTLHTYTVSASIATGTGCSIGQIITSTPFNGRRSGAAPTPFTMTGASDGSFVDRVRIGYFRPDISAACSSANHVLVRDGTDIATFLTGVAGSGAGSYDDTTAVPGTTYSYAIRTDCTSTSLSASSSTDSGYANSPPPPAPSAFTCTEGVFTDRVECSVTAPAAPGCTSRNIVVAVDGVDTFVGSVPVGGGSNTILMPGLTFGLHTFDARSVCVPSNSQSTSISDTGFRLGQAVSPSTLTASDYLYSDRVDLSVVVPGSPQCTSISVVLSRDGTDITTNTSLPPSGGTLNFSDVGVSYGVHTYGARIICSPGGAVSSTVTDTGARLGVPPAPSSIVASDYLYIDRVEITVIAPAAAMCASRDVIIARDGTDISTITSIPVGGGSAVFNDTTATMGLHTYTARSTCAPSGSQSATASDTGALAHPSPTCSALTIPPGPITFSSSGTIPVSVSGMSNVISAVLRVYNSQNGTNDLTSYPLSGSPTGTATILLSNHASGTAEYGALNVSVVLTGENPADSAVECATGTVAIAAGAPVGFTAADGNVTNAVSFAWTAHPGIGTFAIYQCPLLSGTGQWANADNTGAVTLEGEPCVAVVSNIPGSATSATFSVPGVAHQTNSYVIHGISEDGTVNTPLSLADGGYPNRAPTTATAVGLLPYGSTTPITATLSVADANPADSWTITLGTTTTPMGGSLSLVDGSIVYTPGATPFMGVDTFSFTAEDTAGATVSGSGTINGGCPDPTILSMSTTPSRLFPTSPLRLDASYGNANCVHNHDATLSILYAASPVGSYTRPAIPASTSGPLNFDVPALPLTGFYTARLTITNTVTGRSVSRDHTFQVVNYQAPAVALTPLGLEKINTLSLVVTPSADCELTTISSVAATDPSKCLVEVSGLPPGVSLNGSASIPTWSGVPTTPGTFPVSVLVSQYDVFGSPRIVATIPVSTVVQPLSSLVFSAPTPLDAKLHLQPVQSQVGQNSGTSCPLTEDISLAQAAAAAGSLRCLLKVNDPPAGFIRMPLGISGTAHSASVPSTAWTVSVFDSSGTEHPVGSGSIAVNVLPSDLRYDVRFNPAALIASISNVTATPLSIGSDTCPLTTSSAIAIDKTRTTCLFEWNTVPAGLAQPAGYFDPILRGNVSAPGPNTVTFTVSVYDASANKIDLFTGSSTVNAIAPPAPVINLTNMRTAGTDVYAAPLSGGFFGVLNNCTSCGPVTYTLTTAGDPEPRIGSIVSSTGRVSLVGSPAALYSQRATTLRLALAQAPSIYVEKAFTLLSVPPEDVKLQISVASAEVPDTMPVTVTARVGRYTRDGFTYVDSDVGQWRIRFGVVDASATFVPLTSYITTDATGTAVGSISPASYVFMRLVAQAESVTPVPGYVQAIKSPIRVLSVVKGSPIAGTVEVSAANGPAPLTSQLKVVYATRADQLANQSIAWQYSADGGFSWSDVPDVTAATYFVRAPAGVSTYRAVFKNRNTAEVSYSSSASVTAWNLPKVTVAGPSYSFPGATLTLNASAVDSAGSAVPGAVYDWSLSPRATSNPPPAPVASGTGSTATFTPPSSGAFMLRFRARYPDAPASDSRSWFAATKQIVVDAEQRPFVRFTGPSRAEVGKSYDFTAAISAPFPIASSPHTLTGEWTLPSGAVVPGTALSWTPTSSDLAASASASLRYSAWVVGFEATTKTTVSFPVRLWEYIFPTWSITASRTSTYSPSNFAFTAVPSNQALVAGLEGLTYTWSVPPGLSVLGTPSNKLAATAVAGGDYTVSLTVSDSRGNTQTVTSTQSASDPPPFVMSVAVSKVSRWSHSPLTVGITPKITGGHPSDSIVTWSYFVDGVPQLGLPNRAGVQIILPDPGVYTVRADAVSAMGASASQSVSVPVSANVPATCTLTGTPSSTRKVVALRATCTDPDGSISRLQWSVDGVEITGVNLASWNYYLPVSSSLPLTFTLTVSDDGGGSTTSSVTVN